mgnify:CR=1
MKKSKRKNPKKQKKEAARKLEAKMGLFDKVGDECLVCQAPFDKTSREDVNSFRVVVRENKGVVNLYCPSCWDSAIQIIKDFQEKSNVN